jgi:hypothetical protein
MGSLTIVRRRPVASESVNEHKCTMPFSRARRATCTRACARRCVIFPSHHRRAFLDVMARQFETRPLTFRQRAHVEEQRLRDVSAAFARLEKAEQYGTSASGRTGAQAGRIA